MQDMPSPPPSSRDPDGPAEPDAGLDESGLGTEQQLRTLILGVRDCALFMLDANGRVSTWNPGAQRIKGYSAREIIGAPYARFFTPEDVAAGEPARALATAALTGKYEKEGWRVRKNGERFWASVLLDAVRDANGQLIGYAKVTRDVTERRAAQIELEAAREALFQAQKMEAVGQLTGGLAHDFNNMLAGMMGALDLLRSRLANGRVQDANRYLDMALAAAERAARLTQRLLAFGRRQPLRVQAVDVNATVLSMSDLIRRTIGASIHLDLNLADDLPHVRTDLNQLENAILNLAINARDAMPDGGTLTITTARIDRGRRTPQSGVSVIVADTGLGMSPEVLNRACDPFFTTKPLGQGTGLGLSMIQGFASQNGGSLSISSTVGSGTRVALNLPIADATLCRPAQAPAQAAESTRGGGETLLLVEDELQVRTLVTEILIELGYKPVPAEDGPSALRLLENTRPIDGMITDIGLPNGMNGRDLADTVRRIYPDLPILFITGYASGAADRTDFIAEGMDVLIKPFAIETLAARIHTLLQSRAKA